MRRSSTEMPGFFPIINSTWLQWEPQHDPMKTPLRDARSEYVIYDIYSCEPVFLLASKEPNMMGLLIRFQLCATENLQKMADMEALMHLLKLFIFLCHWKYFKIPTS